MTTLFISHSSKDNHWAGELRRAPAPPLWVSVRTETKTYGSAVDMLPFQKLTGRKAL